MQEQRYDGTQKLTVNPTEEELKRAVGNKKNKTVTLHNVGSIIRYSNGSEYQVQENGSLRCVKQKDVR